MIVNVFQYEPDYFTDNTILVMQDLYVPNVQSVVPANMNISYLLFKPMSVPNSVSLAGYNPNTYILFKSVSVPNTQSIVSPGSPIYSTNSLPTAANPAIGNASIQQGNILSADYLFIMSDLNAEYLVAQNAVVGIKATTIDLSSPTVTSKPMVGI